MVVNFNDIEDLKAAHVPDNVLLLVGALLNGIAGNMLFEFLQYSVNRNTYIQLRRHLTGHYTYILKVLNRKSVFNPLYII